MKNVKRMLSVLLLPVLVLTLMTTAVLAAETQSVWLSVTENENSVTALIVTNTTVTDGVVKLSYDSSKLTYQSISVSEGYVAKYAVNPKEDGMVKISWVAPGAYESDAAGLSLIQVTFAGTDGDSLTLSGTLHDADGDLILLEEAAAQPQETTAPSATNPGGGNNSDTGDDTPLETLIAVMAICAMGIVAVVVIMKKRGR